MSKHPARSEADYERLADLAEAGFDPSVVRPRRGRPSLGGQAGASPRVAARLSPEVHARALARAETEGRSLSDVLRQLLEDYADGAQSADTRSAR